MANGHGGRRRGSGAKRGPTARTVAKLNREQIIDQIRAEIAAEQVAGSKAAMSRAKDVLEEFLPFVRNIAVHYQPPLLTDDAPPEQVAAAAKKEEKFKEWLGIMTDLCKVLAPYQSPTFKAVVVAPAPTGPSGPRRFTLAVFDGGRPVALLTPVKPANAA
jgi:hypothetical protein